MTDSFDRRSILALAALAATGVARRGAAQNVADARTQHMREMMSIPPDAPNVAMLVHPEMLLLDLIGPMTVLNVLRCNVQLVWKDKSPVSTDVGVGIVATQTFAECPRDLDVLFVPGGIMGSIDCMNDAVVCDFLADRGARARWVTGVCTGALVLAAAGLLKGYDATTYWSVTDLLARMGARHVDQRVVRDRNRLTGGGVTAGLDFGLTLAAALKGEEAARSVQLILEYAPQPPFLSGTPAQAGPERTAQTRNAGKWMNDQARLAAETARRRLGIAT